MQPLAIGHATRTHGWLWHGSLDLSRPWACRLPSKKGASVEYECLASLLKLSSSSAAFSSRSSLRLHLHAQVDHRFETSRRSVILPRSLCCTAVWLNRLTATSLGDEDWQSRHKIVVMSNVQRSQLLVRAYSAAAIVRHRTHPLCVNTSFTHALRGARVRVSYN